MKIRETGLCLPATRIYKSEPKNEGFDKFKELNFFVAGSSNIENEECLVQKITGARNFSWDIQ